MSELPRDFTADVDAKFHLHVQLLANAACAITWRSVENPQSQCTEMKVGTWTFDGEEVALRFDGLTAAYAWEPFGPFDVPMLVPKFDAPVWRLPIEPLWEKGAVEALDRLAQRSVAWPARVLIAMPWWLRAPCITAAILVLVVAIRSVASIGLFSLAEFGRTIGGVALAGLVAGGVPAALYLPLRRLGYPGSLINGVIAAWSYMLACAWGLGLDNMMRESPALFFGYSAAIGLLVGHCIVHPLARSSAEGR